MNSVLFGILCVGLFILGLYGLSLTEDNLGLECCKLSHDVHSLRVPEFDGGLMMNGKWEDPKEQLIFKKGKVIGLYDICLLKEGEEVKVDYVSPSWGTVCFYHGMESRVNYIFYYFLTVAVLLGAIAGYQYRNIDKGKV